MLKQRLKELDALPSALTYREDEELRRKKRDTRRLIDESDEAVRQNYGRTRPMHRRAKYHIEMANKYERAARYPWLPVAPDPPEPE